LAPPPMPPQGLMAHLQNEQAAAAAQGPTWEIGPFGFGGQMGNNFGQPAFRNDEGPRFMRGGGPRGGMGGGGRGGPRPPFRGGNRGGRR